MCDTVPNEAVIRKIQLLLNLGNRGGTEEEAASAMAKAQELLAKYNLELADVEGKVVQGGTVQPQEKRERTKINRSAMYEWQRQLCRVIAESNFCIYWTQDFREPYKKKAADTFWSYRDIKRHMIVGKESNVVAVSIMYQYLAQTIEDILPYEHKLRLSKSAISWREGCADRLKERIREKARKLMEEPKTTSNGQSYGLVLRSLVEKEWEANYDAIAGPGSYAAVMEARRKAADQPVDPKEEARRKRQSQKWQREYERKWANTDHDAYYAGREVGGQINLGDRLS